MKFLLIMLGVVILLMSCNAEPLPQTPPSDSLGTLPAPPASQAPPLLPVPVPSPIPEPLPPPASPPNPVVPAPLGLENGYTDRLSYAPGDTQTLYLSGLHSETGRLELTDLQGQVVDSVETAVIPQLTTTAQPATDGYGYRPTLTYGVPPLKSGVYFWGGHVPFIVRAEQQQAPIVVLVDTNTTNAYNCAGGRSFYRCGEGIPLAASLSFHRPQPFKTADSFPLLEWLAQQTFDVRYIADSDMDDPDILKGAKLLVVAGHAEYWSGAARRTFDAFVQSGGNAALLSGNTLWWKIRYSSDGSNLICYKAERDTLPDETATGPWDNARFQNPIATSMGVTFSHGGYYTAQAGTGYTMLRPASPLFQKVRLLSSNLLPIARPGNRYEMDGIANYRPGMTTDLEVAQQLGFYRAEVLGYARTESRLTNTPVATDSTMLLFQKRAEEGIVFNASLNGWGQQLRSDASERDAYAQISRNVIEILSTGQDPFSP